MEQTSTKRMKIKTHLIILPAFENAYYELNWNANKVIGKNRCRRRHHAIELCLTVSAVF